MKASGTPTGRNQFWCVIKILTLVNELSWSWPKLESTNHPTLDVRILHLTPSALWVPPHPRNDPSCLALDEALKLKWIFS